jgi:hypothetical protein
MAVARRDVVASACLGCKMCFGAQTILAIANGFDSIGDAFIQRKMRGERWVRWRCRESGIAPANLLFSKLSVFLTAQECAY